MRKIFVANFFDTFIAGAISIAIPLLLLSKGIDIALIGVIIAVLPLVKIGVRSLSASLADQIGFRSIYVANGVANLFELLCFLF